jgi:hypothetical protein
MPLESVDVCLRQRFLSKFPITLPFNKMNANKALTSYQSRIGIAIRTFIRGYYSKRETFGLKGTEFARAKDIISFISGIKPTNERLPTPQSICNLKSRNLIFKQVPRTPETELFAERIRERLPHFRIDLFLKDKEKGKGKGKG